MLAGVWAVRSWRWGCCGAGDSGWSPVSGQLINAMLRNLDFTQEAWPLRHLQEKGKLCLLWGSNPGSSVFKDAGKTKSIWKNWKSNSGEADGERRGRWWQKVSLLYLQRLTCSMCSLKVGRMIIIPVTLLGSVENPKLHFIHVENLSRIS